MTRADLGAAVGGVVGRFARAAPPFAEGAHLYRDLGIASIDALRLLFALEEELCVALDDRRFIQSTTIADLVRIVEEAR